MRTAADLVKTKQHQTVYSVRPDTTVHEAVQVMARHDIGALVVLEGDRVAGVLSERDCARKIILSGRSSTDTLVRDIMTAEVKTVPPGQTSAECMSVMTVSRLRHLPVVEDGRLLGLVSIGDLVKDVIADQSFTIEQLAHYISGDR